MEERATRPAYNVIEQFIRSVQVGQENAIEIAKTVGEDGAEKTTIALQNRVLQPEPPKAPERAESPKRAHEFYGLTGFNAYLVKYKTEDTVVLADVTSEQISAVIDDKADRGVEIVEFTPPISPLFKPWADMLDLAIPLTALAEFIMTHRRSVTDADGVVGEAGRELALLFRQVRASKAITLQRGVGAKSINGLICELEIHGERKGEPVDLPESFTICTPLYLDTEAVALTIDLLVATKGDEIVGVMTCAELEEQKLRIFSGMINDLSDELTVALGRPGHENWKYVR